MQVTTERAAIKRAELPQVLAGTVELVVSIARGEATQRHNYSEEARDG